MLAVLVWLLAAAPARADPPLSVLQAVEVTTSSGTMAGYARWTKDKLYWLNVRKAEGRGGEYVDEPATLEEVRAFLLEEDLLLLTDAYRRKDAVMTTREPLTLARADIKDLRLVSKRLNGWNWTGDVVVQPMPGCRSR
jgi:hypothetical protein